VASLLALVVVSVAGRARPQLAVDAGTPWPPHFPPPAAPATPGTPAPLGAGAGVEMLPLRITEPIASRLDAWIAAWQAAGLQLIARHDAGWARGATMHAPDGSRWLLRVEGDLGYGVQARAWRIASPRLGAIVPGPCVPPTVRRFGRTLYARGVDSTGELHANSMHYGFAPSPIADVDGDGVLDTWVPIDPGRGGCPDDVRYEVFVMRGACGHRVGIVGPGSVPDLGFTMPRAIDPSGLRPIAMEQEHVQTGARGIPVSTTTRRMFVGGVNGYRVGHEDVRTGVCHHCAVSSCSPAGP